MRKKQKTIAAQKANTGRLFILPFTIGFVFLFLQPLCLSLYYAFNTITLGDGLQMAWSGLANFTDILTKDVEFFPFITTEVRKMLTQVPVIIVFSLFIAIILNQKFKGRGIARTIFFLPVIISSGIIISILREDVFNQSITAGSAQAVYIFKSSGIENIMYSFSLPQPVIEFLTNIINSVFDIFWKSGIQILVFLAALQGVPLQLYEAAHIEGATQWEAFWKVTFPLISPMIYVNVIYSIIDSFTDYQNSIIRLINRMAFQNVRYGYASAMAWLYLAVVLALVGLAALFVKKMIVYKTD